MADLKPWSGRWGHGNSKTLKWVLGAATVGMDQLPCIPRVQPSLYESLEEGLSRALTRARDAHRRVLLSWSMPIRSRWPLALLRRAPSGFFESSDGRSIYAWGRAALLQARGPSRFGSLRLQALRLLDSSVFVAESRNAPPPLFLGGCAFDHDHQPAGPWEGFPAAMFLLPEGAITTDPGGTWLQVNRLVQRGEDIRALKARVASMVHDAAEASPPPPSELCPQRSLRLEGAGEAVAWRANVESALSAIKGGLLDKVVLARQVSVPLEDRLNLTVAFARLRTLYKGSYLYLMNPCPGRRFLGASPELLVRLRSGWVESAAVGGSAPRGRNPAEDESLARSLLEAPKERYEHQIVVDHICTRLSKLGAQLHHDPEPQLLRLRNMQHLSTLLQGKLEGAPHIIDVLSELHPTPAVAGCPTDAALRFIRAHETFPRGWYAGAFGWFDAEGEGEFCVALRSGLILPGEARLYAGAGIVQGANPWQEWKETNLKLEPMLEALGYQP